MENKMEDKIHIVTESGFECNIDTDVLDDQEILEALVDIDDNPGNYTKAIKLILGEDGKKKLYDHLRNEKGRVPASKVGITIGEILRLLSEKNKDIKN